MKTVLTLMALLLAAVGTYAQGWEPTGGPEGADVIAIAVNDSALLAAVEPGVIYRREQDGRWTRLADLDVVEMHSTDGVFMARTLDGFHISTDLGENWHQIGLEGQEYRFATDSTNLYVAVDSTLWRLSEGGTAWTDIGTAPVQFYRFFAHDSVILLGRAGDASGLYRSNDKGLNWEIVTTGLPPQGVAHDFHRIGTTIYAAMGNDGVYRSTDWGKSWSAMNDGLPSDLGSHPSIASLGEIRGELWGAGPAGAFSYREGRWGFRAVGRFRTLTSSGEVIYAGSYSGIATLSIPGGEGPRLNSGLAAQRINTIARFGTTVLASANGSIYYSTDRGGTWVQSWMRPNPVVASRFVTSGDAVYALGHSSLSPGVFRSEDGFQWEEVMQGLPFQRHLLSTLAGRGDTLFAGYYRTNWDGEIIWSFGGIYRSVNGGESWQPANSGLPHRGQITVPVTDIHMTPTSVLALTIDGLYRSVDGGDSWSQVLSEFPGKAVPRRFKQDGERIFLASPNKVFLSTDDGLTWTNTGSGIPEEVSINSISVIRGIPYVSASLGENISRIYKLTGSRWTDISSRFPETIQFREFVDLGDKVLASTAWTSVWSGTLDPSSGVPGDGAMPGADLTASPNPFNLGTIIDFKLKERGDVRLTLISPLGEEVATLHEGMIEQGDHQVNLDGGSLPAGVYYLRAEKGDQVRTLRVVKVK